MFALTSETDTFAVWCKAREEKQQRTGRAICDGIGCLDFVQVWYIYPDGQRIGFCLPHDNSMVYREARREVVS